MGLTAKLDGYRRRIIYEWSQHHQLAAVRKRRRVFDAWLSHLTASPPDVLLGANFAAYGGVRNHLQAIQRYSTMNVELAPLEQVMKSLGTHHVVNDFHDEFWNFPANGIKVVHSHVFPWFIEWCREQQSRGKRWVHTYHNHYFPEFAHDGKIEPWQESINDAFINVACHADLRLSVSKWQKEMYQQKFGIATHYVPNGVDVVLCDAAKASRFTRKTGLENFILYVGRKDPVKNPADFVRLAIRLPESQFVMIGIVLSELEADLCLEVPNNLRAFGALTHAEVQDAIAACSVLIVTSLREGLPTLVMEGMAQAKPIVVSSDVGCVEVVGHGEAGIVYELGNISDLEQKTLQALSDESVGIRARNRVLREYDWRVIAPRLDAIYQG